jgi:ubiquinone/menaquinone biosynthesis C-methylase UbiE
LTEPSHPICSYEDSDYQATFWDQGERRYEDRVEAIALQRLLPTGGNLLLELGAGAGRNTERYIGFKQVVLLDYSLTQLQQAVTRLGLNQRYIYVAADIYKLPFVDGLFDAATMIRALHHMADPPAALRQTRQVLRPGAAFILEYANKHNLKAILRYWLKRQNWSPFSLESVEFEKLNYDFHPKVVRQWLKETGFSPQKQLAVSSFRVAAFKKNLPLDLLVKLDGLLQPTGKWLQLSPSMFTRSQAVGDSPTAVNGTFFKCSSCGSADLKPHGFRIICNACDRQWPIRDGIFDFRVDPG